MKHPPGGSMVWRLYAVGVVQLVLVALTAIAIGVAVTRSAARWNLPHLADRIKPLLVRREALLHELLELHARHDVELTVYAESGELIASNVSPPLHRPWWNAVDHVHGPPHWPPQFRPGAGRRGPPTGPPFRQVMYSQVEEGGRKYVIAARPDHRRPYATPIALTFACGLLIVGAGAFLIRRWFTRPLSQLSAAAQAFGSGDLAARTGLSRNDEIGEVGRAFDEMAGHVQQLVLNEKELLANVSHELRTPLARIRVALDMAAEGDAAAARASLAEISLDLAELETLLEDVLHTTRLAIDDRKSVAASFALHPEDIAVQTVIEAAVQRFKLRNPRRPLQLSIDAGASMLRIDPMLFRRVLDNLLDNAHKYSPDPDSPIVLRTARTDERLAIEVSDAGVGISREDLPHVFTPFFRGERSRSRGGGGVGLGLTLAKRIVEAHDGAIEVRSNLGSGATVRIEMPLGQAR
ncbi:MAG: ATP-binding protein [Polyangiales bacterium]